MVEASCVVCGRSGPGRYRRSTRGEVTCAEHPVLDSCALCARPRQDATTPGWRPLASAVRCPTCVSDAIDDQQRARAHLPRIRSELADLGFLLGRRVRVRVVDAAELNRDGPARRLCLGRTDVVVAGAGAAHVVGIVVAAGLPPVHFGATVAHEIGHAWLAQRGVTGLAPAIEEGTCGLLAVAWLKRQPGVLAAELRRQLADNPDPVYGDGYRLVRDAVRGHGVAAVMDALHRGRGLP